MYITLDGASEARRFFEQQKSTLLVFERETDSRTPFTLRKIIEYYFSSISFFLLWNGPFYFFEGVKEWFGIQNEVTRIRNIIV